MNKNDRALGSASLGLVFLSALSAPVMGQGTTDLPPIEVTGTPPPAAPGATTFLGTSLVEEAEGTAVVGQGERTDTVTIVDQQEIQQRRSPVAYDVLNSQPGLNVVNRLGMTGSGLSRLTIRGNGSVGPAGLQVFVDGRPDSTVSFAHPTPSALGLAEVEYIEVIHGPAPTLYGSGRTGVVNIVTADPDPGLHAYLDTNYGSFDTNENYARVSYGGKRGYARVGYSHRSTNGFNPDSEATVRNLNFKGQFILNDVLDVTFAAAQNEDEFDVFQEFFVPGPFTDPRTDQLNLNQTVYDLTVNADFGNVVSSLKFFHDELDPISQVLDPGEKRADVVEQGIRFKTAWEATQSTNIITGVDYLEASVANSPVLPPFFLPPLAIPRARVFEDLDETSFYVFAEQKLTNSITISGGPRFTDHSEYGDVESGELGIMFSPQISGVDTLLNDTTFRARATRGYQSPTLQQLYGVFRGGRRGPANPDLGPELVDQYEVGFNTALPNVNLDVVVWAQDGFDLIGLPVTPPPPPPPPPDIQNDVDYRNRGVEAVLHYALTQNLEGMVGIAISDFDQQTDRFLRVPQRTVDVGFVYTHSLFRKDDLEVSLYGRYAGGIVDIPVEPPNSPQVDLDDYYVAHLKVNLDVTDNATWYFGIDNITDEDYELVFGIPAQPLSAYTGVRVKM